ncbi:MAG: hypothetical protein WCG47_10420, partial [Dermatophilaceae bacterium]
YGAFYRSALSNLLARINTYLMRWVRKKHKRLRAQRKARAAWERVTTQYPRYFAHWPLGQEPADDQDGKSGGTGDCHAPFCGARGCDPPGPPDPALF